VIIGAINVLKMIVCNPNPDEVDWSGFKTTDELYPIRIDSERSGLARPVQMANHGSKLFLVPFFIFHYGLFCSVHGIFVFLLFGRKDFGFGPLAIYPSFAQMFSEERLWWCVIALAASHLWSFLVNFIGRGEYRRVVVPQLMVQPYARIVILHVAILLGGFVTMALGSNAVVLLILIAGKTLLDLTLHLREHERIESAPPEKPPIMPDVITTAAEESSPTRAASER
jgi:hypothetical protein